MIFIKGFIIIVLSILIMCGCSRGEADEALPHAVSTAPQQWGSAVTPFGEFQLIPSVADKNYEMLSHISEYGEEVTALYISPDGDDSLRRELMGEIKALSDEICIGSESDAERLRKICKWVSENISYDRDSAATDVDTYTISLENIFRNGYKTTCGGYANAISALCACQGIYCVNFRGGSASGGYTRSRLEEAPVNHEWCGALIDGEWHFADGAWASDRYYENGVYGSSGKKYDFYCDFTFEEMSAEHRIDLADHRCFELFLPE